MNNSQFLTLEQEVKSVLSENILSFWCGKMVDSENGGFFGRIDGNNNLVSESEKGGILNARILWTFSAAFHELKEPYYLKTAKRAYDYIVSHFFDKEFGGTYWSLNHLGELSNTKKQIYSQAFFIYALVEYFKVSGDKNALEKSIEIFQHIENYSFDDSKGGYFEAYSRDWKLLDDLRLSLKDSNEKKTMNTHLHILEAYTNLYRVWKDGFLATQLEGLLKIFLEKIINKQTNHLDLFFDEDWNCKSGIVSYGHDIEAAWLILEAAEVLGKSELKKLVAKRCLSITQAAEEGLMPDGSLVYEYNFSTGHFDKDRHWWVQAESVVGFLNAYEITGDENYFRRALSAWDYCKNNLIDYTNGEWFWSINSDGSINHTDDKAGFWKCPYHNSRMCLEVMSRIKKILIGINKSVLAT